MPEKDELQEQRDRLDEKREELAQLKADQIATVSSVADEIQKAQLDAEERRLDAEIALIHEEGSPEAIRAGNQKNLDMAKAQMRAAAEFKPVDANAKSAENTSPSDPAKPAGNGSKDGK